MPTFILNGKVYEVLKWMVAIVLPASGTAYLGLAELMNWSNGTTVSAAIMVFVTFLGAILGISTKNFNQSDSVFDGELITEVDPVTGKIVYNLTLNEDVESVIQKETLSFKVVAE